MPKEIVFPSKSQIDQHGGNPAPGGFTAREFKGVEIYRVRNDPMYMNPIPATEDLVEGETYCSSGLFGQYHVGYFRESPGGSHYIDTGTWLGIVERDGDDRHIWAVTGWINKRGIRKETEDSEPTP
jgi:hypothetical protein